MAVRGRALGPVPEQEPQAARSAEPRPARIGDSASRSTLCSQTGGAVGRGSTLSEDWRAGRALGRSGRVSGLLLRQPRPAQGAPGGSTPRLQRTSRLARGDRRTNKHRLANLWRFIHTWVWRRKEENVSLKTPYDTVKTDIKHNLRDFH